MASDRRDLHPLRPSDAASAVDRRVKLRYSYGGKILPRLGDGALRYVGGETRILAVHRDASLPEILRRMGEACGGPVVLRYQLPDEDLDALISVSTSEDLENMMEEYDKMAADNPSAKLRVFLFSASDVSGSGASLLAPYHDLQDTGARYLEAVNGLDSSVRRRDSVTSFSSTQNSDGLTANEGQDVPDLLLTTDYNDQTQVLSSSQYELPPILPNQSKFFNSVQPELPSTTPTVPRPYIEQQFDYPQPFLGSGTPSQINAVVAPDACMSPAQIDTTTAHVGNGMRRVDFQADLNTGRIVRIPGDTKLQPLSTLPPLPPPHFLAPNMERHPVPASSQGLTIKFEDCSLCQKALPHVHSDTLINEQGIGHGHAIPATNMLLQSHYSEDIAKRVPLQTADGGADIQAKNLAVLAPRSHELFQAAPAMSHINVRPSVNSANLDHAKISVPPVSVGLSGALQPSYGIESNPAKSHKEDSVLKQQPLPITRDHSNIVLTPASLATPHNAYGTFLTPQSHREDSSQQQMHLPQKIGFHNYPFNPSFIHKSCVTGANLGGNPDVLALYSHVRPMVGMTQPLSMNPPGAPGFSDYPRPAVFLADIGISKGLNSEQLPFVVVSSHNIGPQDRGSELSISNPLIASGVVPEENSSLLSSQLPSVMRDVAHLQSVQLSNNIHSPYITGNHDLYSYHHEAGAGVRGMFNYADPINDNQANNINLSDKNKDEIPSVYPVEVFSNGSIPQNDSAQLLRNMNQMQQVVSSDPLVSNMDPQKLLDRTILPPGTSNVSSATKDFCNRNYPVNSIGSELTVPVAVSVQTPNSLNMDAPKELSHPLKDLGDAQIKEDIQNTEGRTSASAVTVQSSELPVPDFSSRETKETSHSSFRDHTTIEDKIVIDEKKETKTKQLEKAKNGFPKTDEIGNLQVIKNSDLEELQELGSGSFGTVYHGKWRGTDVAIKRINDRVFSGNSSDQDRARADFLNEACKLGSLHHPNVVAFYGIVLGGPGGSIATVTEFMVNGSLRHVLQKNEKMLDRRQHLLIALDVAFGMEYLHSKNIIHFDLKSDNLLVNLRDPQRPICKVADLGLSKLKYETLMSGGMRGTLPWMAPELLGGKDIKYSEKVDVFSFGIVMWELITGDEPYRDMHYGLIIGGILNNTLRPPVPESCAPEWKSLMEQCWAAEPSQRPGFTEIVNRLRALAASLPQKG
ncbi:RAF-like serine/threonine-protein kinase 20 isoform X2 [Curcuma longa]|uniref:RAF-like serine/threonine-protein kinase 20 isoform X2 n=1 Tax=Curcuma longa TaxID=136217 RepID=UPI003D9EB5B4